jgi:CRISPR type IV-associated protein Csf3
MRPLCVRARLVTPMVVPAAGPPHIDALVAWAVAQRALHEGPCEVATIRALPLPIARDTATGCYQASRLLGLGGGAAWIQATVRRTDVDTLLTDVARGVTSIGARGSIDLASGKLRNYLRLVPRAWIHEVVGWVVGDARAIADLLADVRHVGPLARADAGRVAPEGWTITEDVRAKTRWRWRNLPAAVTLPKDPDRVPRVALQAAVAAPYWDRTTFVLCTAPQFGARDFSLLAEASR